MTEDPAAVLDSLARSRQLRGFVRAGRIDAMPGRQSRRLELLAEVAQIFEPGVRYPEPVVNEFLRAIYPDCAALRTCQSRDTARAGASTAIPDRCEPLALSVAG